MEPFAREIRRDELQALLDLYVHLNPGDEKPGSREASAAWDILIEHHNLFSCLVVELDGEIVSALSLAFVPNLTRGARPYCVVENVVTRPDRRGKGFAAMLLRRAVSLARERGCYKIMLMSGVKRSAAHGLYTKLGFDPDGKKAFFMYL